MTPNDYKQLARAIFGARDEAEVFRLLAPLTADEAEALAQLIEAAVMDEWAERERAKGRPEAELIWKIARGNWVFGRPTDPGRRPQKGLSAGCTVCYFKRPNRMAKNGLFNGMESRALRAVSNVSVQTYLNVVSV
jgi:hypothetical protein